MIKSYHDLEFWNVFHGLLSHISFLSPFINHMSPQIPFYIYFIPYIVITLCIAWTIYIIRKQFKQETILLELVPPSKTEKTIYSTKQLFSVIHSLGHDRSIFNFFKNKKSLYSLELVSSKNQGIRYLIRVPKTDVSNIKRQITTYLQFVEVNEAEDYIPERSSKAKIVEFGLKGRWGLPLNKHQSLLQHDPVSYITGMMTKLNKNELIALQIVISPTMSKEVIKIGNMIINNENVVAYLSKREYPKYVKIFTFFLFLLGELINKVGEHLIWAVQNLHSTPRRKTYERTYESSISVGLQRPERSITEAESEMNKKIQEKIDEELFETTIRALIIVDSKKEEKERINGIKASFNPYKFSKYQEITQRKNFPPILIDKIRSLVFQFRLLSLVNNTSQSLLSVSEIASLYHFPYSDLSQTENISKSLYKELSAPLSQKNEKQDVVFGVNTFGGVLTPIGLTDKKMKQNTIIVGKTGTGKSTIMFNMIRDNILKGESVCLIDPHGDLSEEVINIIPEERINDLIYINPMDLNRPISINLLELPEGLSRTELKLEQDLRCEGLITVFRRLFNNDDGNATRIEGHLRNAIYTAFTVKDRTLFTLNKLLSDPVYLQRVVGNLKDEDLKNFWKNIFGKAGSYQAVSMIKGVTIKLDRFARADMVKRMLKDYHSTINFDEVLDNKKIVICNLSEGKLGDDNTQLIGTMILSLIYQAAQRRIRKDLEARNPLYLYIDEFQTFAMPQFVKLFTQGRKYGIHPIAAEQSLSQQKDMQINNIMLGNTANVISFQLAGKRDAEFMLEQFAPHIEISDLLNLPNYHFYMKMTGARPEEAFSGITLKHEIKKDKEKISRFIEASRQNYGREYVEDEEEQPLIDMSNYKAPKTSDKKGKKSAPGE